MIKDLLDYLENKKILILGFGKEGKSTYNFLRKYFEEKKLFVADRDINLLDKNFELMDDMDLEVSVGDNYLNGIEEYDLIIKAPGISFKGMDISKFETKITSQLELFLEYIPSNTIGITGTKGKSTTSSLMYEVLKNNGKKAFLLGNIGNPIFDSIEEIDEDSYVVIELSSHALQYIKKSVDIAILLNIHEEHLDHYNSFEEYILAKMNIGIYQNDTNYFIVNYDDNELQNKLNDNMDKIMSNIKNISLSDCNDKIDVYIDSDNDIVINKEKIINVKILLNDMNLKGMHNVNNIMFILEASNILNLDLRKSLDAIISFKPLEHRMELVAKIDDVEYYNDSIATIPSSTINAIEAIKNIGTLIVGGNDRGVNLEELYSYLRLSDINNIICLPKTGEYIYEELKNEKNKKVLFVEDLKEAVRISKNITPRGKVCLMSPAASSYGYFKNFEERGKLFKEYVLDNSVI